VYLLVVGGVIKGSGSRTQMMRRANMIRPYRNDWQVVNMHQAFFKKPRREQ